MAEFKKTIPKEEVIASEMRECIISILTDRVKVEVEKQTDNDGVKVTVLYGEQTYFTSIGADELRSFEIHQFIRTAAEELTKSL